MTPAEKLARYLDDEGETVHADIVRSQEEKIKRMSEALRAVQYTFKCENLHHKKRDQHDFEEDCPVVKHYEEALRDAGCEP